MIKSVISVCFSATPNLTLLETELMNMRSWQQGNVVGVIVNLPVQLRIRQKQLIKEPEKDAMM